MDAVQHPRSLGQANGLANELVFRMAASQCFVHSWILKIARVRNMPTSIAVISPPTVPPNAAGASQTTRQPATIETWNLGVPCGLYAFFRDSRVSGLGILTWAGFRRAGARLKSLALGLDDSGHPSS